MESFKKLKKNIWVEKLTIFDVAFFILRGLFSEIIIYFDENRLCGFAKSVLSVLQKLSLCKNFHPAKLSLDKKDSFGCALSYRMEENFDICLEKFCNKYILKEPNWVKSTTKVYIASYLLHRISFITMVEADPKFKNYTGNTKNIFYLIRHPLNSILIPFYKENGLSIEQSPLSSEAIKFYLKPGYHLLSILLTKISFKKIKSNISIVNPSVWVEYSCDGIGDFMFWRGEKVNKDEFDIVYYLDTRDNFSTIATLKAVEDLGLKWIDIRQSLTKIINLKVSELKELIRAFNFYDHHFPLWYKIFKFEYKMWFLLYKSIFKRFKVKILIQYQEASWKQGPQAKAIESVGGIMLGYHWSSMPSYLFSTHLYLQHIFFVWGKVMHDCMQKKVSACRYILPSGLWIGNGREEQGGPSYFSKNFDFIIAIFDSSAAYNLYQSPDSLVKFYLSILKILENNPNWAGVVKSKNWKLSNFKLLPNGDEIVNRLSQLLNDKRLVILNPSSSPVIASANADLSVSYGLNSAGIIAGIYGYHTICWDCSGWLHHPFYKDKDQRFIFQTLEELEGAILKASQRHSTIGDFSQWRQKFNYFNDFKAKQRVGRFIQNFMQGITGTENAEYVLNVTVKKYIEENKISEDFFKLCNFWNTETLKENNAIYDRV